MCVMLYGEIKTLLENILMQILASCRLKRYFWRKQLTPFAHAVQQNFLLVVALLLAA